MSDDTTVMPIGDSGEPHREDARRMQRVLDRYYGTRFQVDRVIGRGGMSTVWLAADLGGDHGSDVGSNGPRDVAVKVLKPELTDDAEFRARFRAEAEAAETVHSPHVVETYDYGEVPDVDGTGVTYCFIIMEYVQGESLADILARERTLPEVMALDLVAQAATGLQAIHNRGLVHRDIKPGNLLITADGVVKVTDFGIAKAASAVPLTRTGMVVGTAQYVSPEQAQGHDVGPTSDVYSLGVVGYEILAGRRPFSGESTVSVALKHISTPAPEIPGEVSAPVRQLIGICLRKDAATRYADGGELAAAAAQVRAGHLPPAPASLPTTLLSGPPTGVAPVVTDTRLGRVTDRSNMGPAPRPAGARSAGSRSTGARPTTSNRRPQKSGAGWMWAGIIAAIAALGVLIWVVTSGLGGSGSQPTPTETTTITNQVPVAPPNNGGGYTPQEETPQRETPVETSTQPPTTESEEQSSTPPPTSQDATPTTSHSGGNGGTGTDTGGTTGGGTGGQTGGNTTSGANAGTGGNSTNGALPSPPGGEPTPASEAATATTGA